MKFNIDIVFAMLCLSILSACGNDGNDSIVPNDPPKNIVADGIGVDNGSVPNVVPKNIVEAPVPPVLAEEPPIATTQQTNGDARINVLSLKRTDGDTMTLRYIVINNNRRDLLIDRTNSRIIDLVNRRRYDIGVASECTVRSEQQQLCWAIFAAPKDNPQTLSVDLRMIGAPPFDLVSVPYSSN